MHPRRDGTPGSCAVARGQCEGSSHHASCLIEQPSCWAINKTEPDTCI